MPGNKWQFMDVQCEVEYDDELGSLAANINVLQKHCLRKKKKAKSLKKKKELH